MTMRDVFFNRLYEYAKQDHDIVVVSADFSAPSLDQFRLNLPSQYIFAGISEQSMILLAAGLALEGKKVFCYAIAPFLTMRCFEQIRNYPAGMKLPVTLVGVGAGLSYDDSGYTHHAVEDIAILRSLPNMRILQPCDNTDVKLMLECALKSENPLYLRLDRYGIDELFSGERDIGSGFQVVKKVQPVTIAASGSMMRTALEAWETLEREGLPVGLVNLASIPLDGEAFEKAMSGVRTVVSLEEHTLSGGIGSYLLELISDRAMNIRVKRLGLDLSEGFVEQFGGRKELHRMYQMDAEAINTLVKEMLV